MRRFALVAAMLVVVGCDDGAEPTLIDNGDGGTDGPSLVVAAGDVATPDQDPGMPDDVGVVPDVGVATDADVSVQADVPDMAPQTACANGADDDGDGAIDYPADPGCADAADDDETDPDQAECGDGADNDDDGRTDHPDDPGCASPEDPSELSMCGDLPHDVADISAVGRVEDTTFGRPPILDSCRTNRAPEAIYRFTLRDRVGRLHLDTQGSLFDTQLAVYRDCPTVDAEPFACNDDATDDVRYSAIDIEQPELGDYIVVVDGFLEESGPFVLTVRAEIADGQPCGDLTPPLSCAPGRVCRDGTCTPAQCSDFRDNDNDGVSDFPNEPGCESPDDDDETDPDSIPECSDGIDNDLNGFTDYPDDEWCASAADTEERRPPQCRDGRDNDRDGFVDLADPGCQGDPERDNEFNIEACRNGQDDDEDGHQDYPNDPGCEGPRDPDERDPNPPPACGDGEDNDGNGSADYPEDAAGCTYAADPTEGDPCIDLEPVDITGLGNTRGNTDDAANEFRASCGFDSGPESVLLWRVEDDRPLQRMVATTRGTSFDTVLHVRDRCDAPAADELACDDDGGPSGSSVVRLGPQAPGMELWFFVDGARGDTGGIWRLEILAFLAEGANCEGRGGYLCGDGLACHEQNDGALLCTPSACADGVDNDEDGVADWPAEPGCANSRDDDESDDAGPLAACNNGLDDDGDGAVDWPDDAKCIGAADPSEEPECRDGVDNDEDGAVDFDRDGNGFADRNADRGCACAGDFTELTREAQCGDGCDNDNDGAIDLEDPGCNGDPERDNEFNVAHCRDGEDNDGDGHTDFPNDPGCPTRNHHTEVDPDPAPECGDGEDNDGDGEIDFADGFGDDGCNSAADDDERGPCELEHRRFPEDVRERLGSTEGRSHQFSGTCGFGQAPDEVYVVRVPYAGNVRLSTVGSDFDTVLYARSVCEALTVCDEPDPPPPEPDAGVPEPDAAIPDASVPDAAPDAGAPDPDGAAAEPDAFMPGCAFDEDCGPGAVCVDGLCEVPQPECFENADCNEGDMCNVGRCVEEDGDPPCVAGLSTELACNDDFQGVQSEIEFRAEPGDFFAFIDGFADGGIGNYVLTVEVTYTLGSRCGPDLVEYAECEGGTACLPDGAAGFPTCQLQ